MGFYISLTHIIGFDLNVFFLCKICAFKWVICFSFIHFEDKFINCQKNTEQKLDGCNIDDHHNHKFSIFVLTIRIQKMTSKLCVKCKQASMKFIEVSLMSLYYFLNLFAALNFTRVNEYLCNYYMYAREDVSNCKIYVETCVFLNRDICLKTQIIQCQMHELK